MKSNSRVNGHLNTSSHVLGHRLPEVGTMSDKGLLCFGLLAPTFANCSFTRKGALDFQICLPSPLYPPTLIN